MNSPRQKSGEKLICFIGGFLTPAQWCTLEQQGRTEHVSLSSPEPVISCCSFRARQCRICSSLVRHLSEQALGFQKNALQRQFDVPAAAREEKRQCLFSDNGAKITLKGRGSPF